MTDLDDLIARLLGQFGAGDFAGTPPIAARHVSVMLKERAEAAAALEALRDEVARKDAAITEALAELERQKGEEMFLTHHLFVSNARDKLRAALR